MNVMRYWPFFEAALIILVFAFIIWRLWRSGKRRSIDAPAPRPRTLGGKIRYAVIYVSKLFGVGVGAFLAVALVVMIERSI